MSVEGWEYGWVRSVLVSGCVKGSFGVCGTGTGKWKCLAMDVWNGDMMSEYMSMSSTVHLADDRTGN